MNTPDINRLCMGCFGQLPVPGSVCPSCLYNEAAQAHQPQVLRPRSILNGKYMVGRVIGQGGFGITYIGWDLNLEIKAAIKEYFPVGFVSRDSAASLEVRALDGPKNAYFEKGKQSFLAEVKRLAKFSNLPGIVSVKDYFRENNTAYIVMEYLEGKTLKEHLVRMGGRLPGEQVFDMIKPVISSIRDVHMSGLIHRDISPENIMICANGSMKLLDFGAAREYADSGNKSLSVMLKPGYAPEEQYRSKGVQGPWTDVYALSATIYKCITGNTPNEAMERVAEDTLKPPSQLGFSITAKQEFAVMKGLAVRQGDRFQSMGEFYEVLYGNHHSTGGEWRQPSKGVNFASNESEPPARAETSSAPTAKAQPVPIIEKLLSLPQKLLPQIKKISLLFKKLPAPMQGDMEQRTVNIVIAACIAVIALVIIIGLSLLLTSC